MSILFSKLFNCVLYFSKTNLKKVMFISFQRKKLFCRIQEHFVIKIALVIRLHLKEIVPKKKQELKKKKEIIQDPHVLQLGKNEHLGNHRSSCMEKISLRNLC